MEGAANTPSGRGTRKEPSLKMNIKFVQILRDGSFLVQAISCGIENAASSLMTSK